MTVKPPSVFTARAAATASTDHQGHLQGRGRGRGRREMAWISKATVDDALRSCRQHSVNRCDRATAVTYPGFHICRNTISSFPFLLSHLPFPPLSSIPPVLLCFLRSTPVIRAPPWPRDYCKLSSGQESGRKRVLVYFEVKLTRPATSFAVFCDTVNCEKCTQSDHIGMIDLFIWH